MQPIIDQLQTALRGNLALLIGCVLVGLLTLQVLLMLYVMLRRIYFDREQRRLSRERLQLLIKAAKDQCREVEQVKLLWNGYRKFQVVEKINECDDVYSFYLAPHDGKPLPAFGPGQYLTFQLDIPGRDKSLVRCYSLSDSPNDRRYRMTIKKEKPPPDRSDLPLGVASGYFCDAVKEGDILNVKAPTGKFFLDMSKTNPIVLIAGGVGVTPLLCMAKAVAATGSKREVWFFYGVRNRKEHIHKAEIDKLAAENNNIHLHVCYSRPDSADVKERDYHHEGRVSIDLLKQVLPSNNFEYYLCGNGAFMKSITDGLEAWGVPDDHVHFETFGPASVEKVDKKVAPAAGAPADGEPVVRVTFSKSGQSYVWDPGAKNLLRFALSQGVRIDSGCCAGSCSTCLVAIKSGSVDYVEKPDAELEEGSCLTCVCRPKTDLILDA